MMSSASAKIILFGEHAVVYGEPAIAVPVSSLRAYAEVTENTPFQIIARDLNDKIITFDGEDPLAQVVRITLEALNMPIPDISIAVRSDIPIASGLGSGAAISTAITRALLDYFEMVLPLDAINEIVYEVEKFHHGTPSGIDNTVIVYEQSVYFVREQAIEMIENSKPLQIIVADTGKVALTRDSVGDVARLYEESDETKDIIHEIGIIARNAREAMQSGDLQKLGSLMLENHALLQKITVSSPELDKLVDVAMSAGAMGAKLSGGGRGGNMITLVDENTSKQVQNALKKAGAVRVFETTVGKSNGNSG